MDLHAVVVRVLLLTVLVHMASDASQGPFESASAALSVHLLGQRSVVCMCGERITMRGRVTSVMRDNVTRFCKFVNQL